ncbi:hypothetical protein [Desulfolithobacter sp.]
MPGSLLLLTDQAGNQDYLGQRLPFIQAIPADRDRPAAHVCRDGVCLAPVAEPVALAKILQNKT